MAADRIKSTTSPLGTSPYTFPYNPTEFDSQDSIYAESIPILHGAPAWQKKKWDGRPRTFVWRNIGVTTTVDAIGRAAMVDYMRPWLGTVRYFNFKDLARANANWPGTDVTVGWRKARVIDLQAEIKPGGQLRYETVKLVIQPEP